MLYFSPGKQWGGIDFFFQFNDGRMQSKLQNIVDPLAGLLFYLGQCIQIPRVEHQRLFADGIGPDPEGKTDMGIVQIVRRANADIIEFFVSVLSSQFLGKPIETLKPR